MKKILFIALAVMFTGCITQKRCLSRYPPQITSDSIYIEKLKEVPIYVPGDTVNLEVPIKCPDQDIVSMENSKLRQVIKILNGKLFSSTEIKPDTVKILVPEIHTSVTEVKIPAPVRYTPKIYLIAFWMDIGILIAVALYIAYKIFKPKIL